jgi:hypothetical protein
MSILTGLAFGHIIFVGLNAKTNGKARKFNMFVRYAERPSSGVLAGRVSSIVRLSAGQNAQSGNAMR